MKSFTEMLAEIDSGHATMADVDKYVAEVEAQRKAESERTARAHAALARKRAFENTLHGQSRISYALSARK